MRRSGRTWRGKSVVTVLRGRYLSGAARSCDVRTACQANLWAAALGISEHTVGKWRRRFLIDRCDGLLDEGHCTCSLSSLSSARTPQVCAEGNKWLLLVLQVIL